MELPETIEVVIPWEKEYDPNIYTDDKNCYLAEALKRLEYSNFTVSPHHVVFLDNLEEYIIENDLLPARIKKAFDNKEDIHIKLTKI